MDGAAFIVYEHTPRTSRLSRATPPPPTRRDQIGEKVEDAPDVTTGTFVTFCSSFPPPFFSAAVGDGAAAGFDGAAAVAPRNCAASAARSAIAAFLVDICGARARGRFISTIVGAGAAAAASCHPV